MYVRPGRGRQFAPGVDFLKTGLRPKFLEPRQTLIDNFSSDDEKREKSETLGIALGGVWEGLWAD